MNSNSAPERVVEQVDLCVGVHGARHADALCF